MALIKKWNNSVRLDKFEKEKSPKVCGAWYAKCQYNNNIYSQALFSSLVERARFFLPEFTKYRCNKNWICSPIARAKEKASKVTRHGRGIHGHTYTREKREAEKRVTLPFISIIKRINKIAIHSVKHMFNFLSCSLGHEFWCSLDTMASYLAVLRTDYSFLWFFL